MYDDNLSMVPAELRRLATETAADLGREWTVKAILSSPLVVHPFGHRVMVHDKDGHIQLTARVSVDADPHATVEEVTARVPASGHPADARRTADAIRTRILPHLSCKDAIAALRMLSLPLRDADIPATVHGSSKQITMAYRRRDFASLPAQFQPGERRPFQAIIRSPRNGHTHTEIYIPHLAVQDAALIAAAVLPLVYTPVPVPTYYPLAVQDLAAQLPGMTAAEVIRDDPQLIDLTDPSGHLTLRHFLDFTDSGTRSSAAVGLSDAPLATAYALLSTYAAL
ncbi:hypothetical protein [Streptomyces chartreusis]|uniref:hypothetical protein n=1 Tax=Streptomyces chartreusis TaxID=1969 RepID=UPI001673150A|nr:hypothetical protein [Streptomyces chartreusis]GGX56028.1 hypothetical protein GCM10010321_86610 [Streptomyces chartreusis]